MPSVVSDAVIIKLMKQGLGRKLLEKAVGVQLCSRRLGRLRNENDIPVRSVVRFSVSDAVLESLLLKGFGRRKITEIVGREIGSRRLRRIKDRIGVDRGTPAGHLSDDELRTLLLRGISGDGIREITGITVSGDRLRRLREKMAEPNKLRAGSKAARGATADLVRRIQRSLSHIADPILRDDAESEMFLAVVEGRLSIDNIEVEARAFGSAQIGLWQSRFAPRSLDERDAETDISLLDQIEDPGALDAFDNIFNDEAI